MKVFLLIYDRRNRRLRSIEDFGTDRAAAAAARLSAELKDFAEHSDLEIVTLEAESEEVLHRTHGTYFQPLEAFVPAPFRKAVA